MLEKRKHDREPDRGLERKRWRWGQKRGREEKGTREGGWERGIDRDIER